MKTLCIDPGPKCSGVVLIQDNKIIYSEKIHTHEILLKPWVNRGDTVLIEKIEPRGNVVGHSVIDTCIMIGRLVQYFKSIQANVVLIERREVLRGLQCKNDSAVLKYVKDQIANKIITSKVKITRDCWQAAALYLYYNE